MKPARKGARKGSARRGAVDLVAPVQPARPSPAAFERVLQAQNQALQQAQHALAAARDRFADLYDFAPVGYITLDAEGRITEANHAAAALLGSSRAQLQGTAFASCVDDAQRARWPLHLHDALRHDGPSRIELALRTPGGAAVLAQLDGRRVQADGAAPSLRVTLTDLSHRRQAEIDRRLAARAVEARESERRRVSRELHDELGQRLSALKMELAGLRGTGEPTQRAQVATMLESLDEAVATVRRIATELRPLMLDDLGLNAAIEWLARESSQRLGLSIRIQLDEVEPPLGERRAIALYRTLQDALARIARHADARHVDIQMLRRAHELILCVRDDGQGWPDAATVGDADDADLTLGLRQQARLLGARLRFDTLPQGGRRMTLRLPLPREPDAG